MADEDKQPKPKEKPEVKIFKEGGVNEKPSMPRPPSPKGEGKK